MTQEWEEIKEGSRSKMNLEKTKLGRKEEGNEIRVRKTKKERGS